MSINSKGAALGQRFLLLLKRDWPNPPLQERQFFLRNILRNIFSIESSPDFSFIGADNINNTLGFLLKWQGELKILNRDSSSPYCQDRGL
jgi:hypothetical protein